MAQPTNDMVRINNKVGEINVPQQMVDDMGWERIQREVIRSFQLMHYCQPNESIAWGLAVNNVYAAWKGAHTLRTH